MDLNKHIITNGELPVHSNGYARVANGNRIGAASHESFERRLMLDSNRKIINSYRRSSIGSSYGEQRAKAISNDLRPNLSSLKSSSNGRFSGPSGRGYNPFA
ncbi:hypothetical protein HGB24_01870 [Candidatus Saccharibacteria bacterium]|nr:hypothetical protein [Candidatus Saccharibacteria bacterium]